MKELLGACRQAALPAVWSAGVKLARDGAVTLETTALGESLLRVRDRGRPVAQHVVLYTNDHEWSCDCDSRADPCSHVVAAVIAASQPGALSARSQACPHLRYTLDSTEPKALKLRVDLIEPDGTSRAIDGPLSRLLATTPTGFSLDPHDLELENIIRAGRGGRLVLGRARETFEVLARAREVYLDQEPVVISAEPLVPDARVTDDGRGSYTLAVRAPEGLTVVAPGVGRLANVLRPLGVIELAGMSFERLPIVEQFPPERVELLLTQALPQLEARLPVKIATTRLPRQERLASEPRVDFELTHGKDGLSVLPLIVYGKPAIARLDGDRLVPLQGALPRRSPKEERDLIERLRSELNLSPGRRVTFAGVAAARFVEQLLAFQRRVDRVGSLALELPVLRPEVEFTDTRLDARFTLPRGELAEVAQVLSAFRSGLGVVPLVDGSLALVPSEWLERHGAWLEELWALRNERGALPAFAAPAALELLAALGQPVPAPFERLRQWFEDFSGLPEARPPARFTATLRPYQQAGVNWLTFLRDARLGAILADDMGLGKTPQTLAVLRGRSLVVCPRSLLFNWAAEAARFRPDLSVAIYHGSERELDPHADLTLTSYGVLRLDAPSLAQTKWDCLIFDEAQNLKNPESQLARAAYSLTADFKVALSGTPVENRLLDLWSLSELTNPGLLGSREAFEARYATPIGLGDAEAQARLARRVHPFLLRRLKRDVLTELPPRSEVVLTVELLPEEREVYELLRATARRDVLSELGQSGNVMRALEALLRLRQAACHLGLLPGRTAQGSAKLTCLLERIEALTSEGHRAIVFSQWTSLLDLLEPGLMEQGTRFLRLDGSTKDRQAVVDGFQAEDGPPLLLATLKAGGTGLNLTRADHVFLLDPWWNPAAEDQAADRAHRIGQKRPVLVHRLIAKDTIDERLLLLQEHKRALMVGLFEGGAGASGNLTREDLLALLE
jgi:hypothetical protein